MPVARSRFTILTEQTEFAGPLRTHLGGIRANPVGPACNPRQVFRLTAEEAFNLFMSLTYHFQDDEVDPGWHCHVGGGDGEPELTIAIEN